MLGLRRCKNCVASSHALGSAAISPSSRRSLLTLAIETSCDDTSVAILERHDGQAYIHESRPPCTLHFHEKITADNSKYRGIHPLTSLASHQSILATLIRKSLLSLPVPPADGLSSSFILRSINGSNTQKMRPDFISVTRGPGMRSSLSTGIDTAKGLATAWQIPLLAVNHMQAHALTPRLVHALSLLSADQTQRHTQPSFPFLSLLVSGGHTLLLHSRSLCSHPILAATSDIAIGDCIDKIARCVLPPDLLRHTLDTSQNRFAYGRLLEDFAFPTGTTDYNYTPPINRAKELERKSTPYGWSLCPPLAETRSGEKSRSMEFSFSGLDSAVRRAVEAKDPSEREANEGEGSGSGMGVAERQYLAREAMRVAFEHLASRVVMALQTLQISESPISTLVVSGGVASNGFLRHLLRAFLAVRGFPHIKLCFPPPALCTDNAAMIAWCGLEMWDAGWESNLDVRALKKWTLDDSGEDGGVLGVGGWVRRNETM